ncbi:hypothetical protein KIN20_032974 [Parelaphostrongylus tenuis]|uniref:Cyanocobalamin reductase (cyanide-eliminating) n=1 Tax=Parelaphostrongylus tenuis TaxID=148309 RepID=A0AAD5R7J1_PARTN|nr:hypothetical protein KIN20_032974 [Parelaphostrongylus tenuis]
MSHTSDVTCGSVYLVKEVIDGELPIEDGFETHLFKIGDYNNAVDTHFKLPYDENAAGILIISTPDMFRRFV